MTRIFSGIAPDDESPRERPARRRSRRLLKIILAFLAALWILDAGISLLIQHTRLQRRLTSHLEAAFGRPVQVRRYEFSLWTGPALEAEYVRVAEDPRFGYEYFLRAESLTVRLHWLSLFRGHIELGTLSLSHPSLNLVRNPDGDWNLYEWLPKPAGAPATSPGGTIGPVRSNVFVLHFRKIEIDGGRINFKAGPEKLPFAFVNVNGAFETDSPGRWRIDLEATPMRAATVVQQPGTLHLTGHVGGTSSRLRPASLALEWRDASLTDVLRLARSYDYGVHGTLALAVSAETQGEDWQFDGRAELRQIHRWDLAIRPDNPALNLIWRAKLDLPAKRLEVTRATLETPRSRAHAEGAFDWNGASGGGRGAAAGTHLEISSDGIALDEGLAWLRAFHPNVAEDLTLHGAARLEMALRGWPPQLTQGTVIVGGAELAGRELRAPVRIGAAEARYNAKGLRLSSTQISMGSTQTALAVTASARFGAVPASDLRVMGGMDQTRDILRVMKALGWNISGGWDFGGPLHCDLQWQGARWPWQTGPTGSAVWGSEGSGGTIRAPFLNQPIEGIRAREDFQAGDRHVALAAAQAFGAHWTGTMDRNRVETQWRFSLAADRLTGAEMDLWLNPRWRESFLDRMLPFLNPRTASTAAPDNLRASGQLSVGELELAPLRARKLQGRFTMDGRQIEFAGVTGQMYGGTLSGSLEAGLVAPPAYHAALKFARVDVGALTANSPELANLFEGAASGEISFHARGASRDELLASLECSGTANVANAELRGLNLAESVRDGARHAGSSAFRQGTAAFSCANRAIHFRELKFSGPQAEVDGAGTVDFRGGVDMRTELLSPGAALVKMPPRAAKISGAPGAVAQVSGTLASPAFRKIAAAKPR